MAERGARPRVPAVRRRLLRAARVFFTPLLPDDYLELIDPLWSSRELRGRIEAITRETADSVTVTIRPGWVWEGHEPGQYLRVGVIVDGVHHWRAYSITSDPGRPDGFISITPEAGRDGQGDAVSGPEGASGHDRAAGRGGGDVHAARPAAAAAVVHQRRQRRHADHEHVARPRPARRRCRTSRIFTRRGRRTRSSSASSCARWPTGIDGYRLHVQHTGECGRLAPADLDRLCPDWREREAFLSGPGEMLDAMHSPLGGARGRRAPAHGALPAGHRGRRRGRGGRRDLASWQRRDGARRTGARRFSSPARRSAPRCRSAAAWASATPAWVACAPDGYATCGPGRCRAREGEMVRTCINAPEGPVEIDL